MYNSNRRIRTTPKRKKKRKKEKKEREEKEREEKEKQNRLLKSLTVSPWTFRIEGSEPHRKGKKEKKKKEKKKKEKPIAQIINSITMDISNRRIRTSL